MSQTKISCASVSSSLSLGVLDVTCRGDLNWLSGKHKFDVFFIRDKTAGLWGRKHVAAFCFKAQPTRHRAKQTHAALTEREGDNQRVFLAKERIKSWKEAESESLSGGVWSAIGSPTSLQEETVLQRRPHCAAAAPPWWRSGCTAAALCPETHRRREGGGGYYQVFGAFIVNLTFLRHSINLSAIFVLNMYM